MRGEYEQEDTGNQTPHALEGKFSASRTPYGYLKGTDEKRTFVIDEETAPVMRRIFEMYASGISPDRIASTLNTEGIPCTGRIAFLEPAGSITTTSTPIGSRQPFGLCSKILPISDIGHSKNSPAFRTKKHKMIAKDQSDWVIIYNAHPPIISQELWDRVQERMKSRAKGKKTQKGIANPLSGFLYCADCGGKPKITGNEKTIEIVYKADIVSALRYKLKK